MKNSLKMKVLSAAVTASALTAGLALAGAGGASAAVRPAATRSVAAACSVSAKNYAFPRAATTYRAGSAGTVRVAAVNGGMIKVTGAASGPGMALDGGLRLGFVGGRVLSQRRAPGEVRGRDQRLGWPDRHGHHLLS